MPIVTLRRSRAGNGRIESLIRVAGHHQNHGTYFEQGKANSYFEPTCSGHSNYHPTHGILGLDRLWDRQLLSSLARLRWPLLETRRS